MSIDPGGARLQALRQQALAHLQRGRADLARPVVEEIAPLLAWRPDLVAQMRQIVAVVGFDWPAERASPPPAAPVTPPAPGEVELVAFHVDRAAVPSGVHGAVDYGEVLQHSFASARLRAPLARRVLLTDEATVLPALEGVEVLRFALDRERLMFERMRIQEQFLRERAPGRATVLMDSDVVVNAEPSAIFAERFGIGLTYRLGAPEAPFNGGMIFVSPGDGGVRWFGRALACYEALAATPAVASLYATDLRAWWGDQFALAALVGYRAFAERTRDALLVDGIEVRFFPCDSHNYTFEGRPQTREEMRRRFFVHFKGQRKHLQARYLQEMQAGRL